MFQLLTTVTMIATAIQGRNRITIEKVITLMKEVVLVLISVESRRK